MHFKMGGRLHGSRRTPPVQIQTAVQISRPPTYKQGYGHATTVHSDLQEPENHDLQLVPPRFFSIVIHSERSFVSHTVVPYDPQGLRRILRTKNRKQSSLTVRKDEFFAVSGLLIDTHILCRATGDKLCPKMAQENISKRR